MGFGVVFPDVPGCDLVAESGAELAAPSDLADLRVDGDVTVAARVLIRVEKPSRTVRVNITLPEGTLKAVDNYARRHGYNRSNFLAYAARETMKRA